MLRLIPAGRGRRWVRVLHIPAGLHHAEVADDAAIDGEEGQDVARLVEREDLLWVVEPATVEGEPVDLVGARREDMAWPRVLSCTMSIGGPQSSRWIAIGRLRALRQQGRCDGGLFARTPVCPDPAPPLALPDLARFATVSRRIGAPIPQCSVKIEEERGTHTAHPAGRPGGRRRCDLVTRSMYDPIGGGDPQPEYDGDNDALGGADQIAEDLAEAFEGQPADIDD